MTRLQDFLNSLVSDITPIRGRVKAGDLYGLEIECEGKNVAWDGGDMEIVKDWKPENDGSLRNNHGQAQEWVFNGPVTYPESVTRVNKLFSFFKSRKAKIVCSNRTSVHAHFNMADKRAYQLVNLFILFTILEGVFDRYCGEEREGNLFCLSTRHAEHQLNWLNDAVFKHYNFAHFNVEWRYCSLNIASLSKFGSVEFRGMRGLDNEEDVLAWLEIIHEFCEYACYTMKNPVDTIQMVSAEGPLGLLQKIFSKANVARLTRDFPEPLLNASIYEGVRLVQMLSYRIGTEFDQVRLQGRDFWSSFGGAKKVELDVDPELFEGGQNPFDRPRGRGRPLDPFDGGGGEPPGAIQRPDGLPRDWMVLGINDGQIVWGPPPMGREEGPVPAEPVEPAPERLAPQRFFNQRRYGVVNDLMQADLQQRMNEEAQRLRDRRVQLANREEGENNG